jgi:alkyldihydroxyacetonephosphate synthase
MTELPDAGSSASPNPAVNVADQLRAALGDQVTTDGATLDALSHDSWPVAVLANQLGRHDTRPEIVVAAAEEADVGAVLAIARRTGTPVTARGLGSSVTGQPLPTRGGIVLDLSGLVGEPELDETNAIVTAPAGVRGSDLEAWLNERGRTLNFFPQSLPRSSIGGWIATRATGQLSSRYGGIEDAAVGYRVLLSDGLTVEVGSRPRAAVGPDLRELFLGSEGMFGIVTRVSLKVYDLPAWRAHDAYELPTVRAGIEALRGIFQAGLRPSLMRLYDPAEARHATGGRESAGAVLFLTHEGLESVGAAERAESARIVAALGGQSLGGELVARWYERRFDFSAVENLLAEDGGYAETIEVAHLWSGIEDLYQRLTTALAPYADEVLGHFSHVYTHGVSLYVILLGRARDNQEAARRLQEIWRVAMEATLSAGGELSHHHGAGLARQEFVADSLGSGHEVLRRLKNALDKVSILNPGHLGL